MFFVEFLVYKHIFFCFWFVFELVYPNLFFFVVVFSKYSRSFDVFFLTCWAGARFFYLFFFCLFFDNMCMSDVIRSSSERCFHCHAFLHSFLMHSEYYRRFHFGLFLGLHSFFNFPVFFLHLLLLLLSIHFIARICWPKKKQQKCCQFWFRINQNLR